MRRLRAAVRLAASGAAKIAWVLGIIILPVLGFIVWLIAGPRGNKAHV